MNRHPSLAVINSVRSSIDPSLRRELHQRAFGLGKSGDPSALPGLISLLQTPSPAVRRIAASAIGKLADFGGHATSAVQALVHVALHDHHPQVQQYALAALKSYGAAASAHLHDFDDLAINPRVKDYVRVAAARAAQTVRGAITAEKAAAHHSCARCGRHVTAHEHTQSQQAFQRTFCDPCFDAVFLDRRNFETKVELAKIVAAQSGTVVQSDGERLIADWLTSHSITYRYDERFRILNGYTIRPDFHLPEFDLYIEFWGMDTADYKIGMLKKQQLYQQQGKRLISVYPADKPRLDSLLRRKLAHFGYTIP